MAHVPSKADILDWIAANPTLTSKRDIAKAFGIKGAARIDLKAVLRELEDEMDNLEQQFEQELRSVNEKWARIAADSQEYRITAYKKDIHLELFGIAWLPFWYAEINNQPLLLQAL